MRAEVELIIIDDAHDLTLDHLAYVKELTDNLAAPPYEPRVGLCLVSASGQGIVPLRGTYRTRQELIWRQFRRRLDPGRSYCLVLGHTEERRCGISVLAMRKSIAPNFASSAWSGGHSRSTAGSSIRCSTRSEAAGCRCPT